MATLPRGARLTVEGWTPAERDAVNRAAAADRRSTNSWARMTLLDAAAELGFRPAEPVPAEQQPMPDCTEAR